MSGLTHIEWTDASWNPVTGCSKVSAGCKNCYAERYFKRPYPKRKFTDVSTHPERLDWPLRWRGSKQAKAEGRPSRIFVNSMSDLFHESVPFDFMTAALLEMSLSGHTFQILTKRPSRMQRFFREWDANVEILAHDTWPSNDFYDRTIQTLARSKMRLPIPNVWFGVSVEDQKTADERIPILLQTPAAVRWVSYEPALGPVDFEKYVNREIGSGQSAGDSRLPTSDCRLDWIVAGGESGPRARPPHPDWFRTVRDQCQAAGVPFFFKQWGEWEPVEPKDRLKNWPQKLFTWPDETVSYRVGKHEAGRLLDGREWNEFPQMQEAGNRK